MRTSDVKLLGVIAVSAVISAGALGVAATMAQASPSTVADSTMSTGSTSTETTAPSELPVSEAVPSITGAAPLPSEEQGVPG